MRRAPHLWLLLALAAAGCDDLGDYATGPGEVYRGTVVGVEDPSLVRRGFDSSTQLTLTFDPTRATSVSTPPGHLSTSDDALRDVPLVPIVPLTHDALSEYEIPIGARVRNYIFLLQPADGPLAAREPFVFLSLMSDGSIEARVIAGGGAAAGDYFGLFRLHRQPE